MKQYNLGETPNYLREMHIPTDQIDCIRFKPAELNSLYEQMRFNTGEKGSLDTLDHQTFINIMLIAFRQGRVPLAWQYTSFDSIITFANSLSMKIIEGPVNFND